MNANFNNEKNKFKIRKGYKIEKIIGIPLGFFLFVLVFIPFLFKKTMKIYSI